MPKAEAIALRGLSAFMAVKVCPSLLVTLLLSFLLFVSRAFQTRAAVVAGKVAARAADWEIYDSVNDTAVRPSSTVLEAVLSSFISDAVDDNVLLEADNWLELPNSRRINCNDEAAKLVKVYPCQLYGFLLCDKLAVFYPLDSSGRTSISC